MQRQTVPLLGLNGITHFLAGALDVLETFTHTGSGSIVSFVAELDHIFFECSYELFDFFGDAGFVRRCGSEAGAFESLDAHRAGDGTG